MYSFRLISTCFSSAQRAAAAAIIGSGCTAAACDRIFKKGLIRLASPETKPALRPAALDRLDSELNIKTFIKENQGKLVLIVGHSNTTPKLVNDILGDQKFEQMQDNDNSSLFIIRESNGKMTAERISVSY